MKKIFYHHAKIAAVLLASAFVFASCTRDTPGGSGSGEKITFDMAFAQTGTAFRNTWESGDRIGIFAVESGSALAETGNYIDNVSLTYDGTSWKPASPLNWPGKGAKLDFYAYYPYETDTNPTEMSFMVQTDQNGAGLGQSDLLMAKATDKAEGSEVLLSFSHLMAMVQFTLDDESGEFDPGGDITVTMQNVRPGTSVSLSDKNAVAIGGVTGVAMSRVTGAEGYVFKALIPAQTVATGVSLFRVTGGTADFESAALTSDLTLVPGMAEDLTQAAPLPGVEGGITYTDGTNAAVRVKSTSDGLYRIEAGGSGRKTIYSVEFLENSYLIGRPDDETVTLKLDAEGNPVFRGADSDGNIPIGSYAELVMILTGEETLAGKYLQEGDLDLLGASLPAGLESQSWMPAGNADTPFTGSFDGDGHTIANLYINAREVEDVGFFGAVGPGGKLSGINIVSGQVAGKNHTGGVCGWNEGSIERCSFDGEVSGNWEVAGICGWNEGAGSTIVDCRNYGKIKGIGDRVGGVCGRNLGSITGSFSDSKGTVAGVNNVGGVCGMNLGTVTGSYNKSEVTGGWEVGGVCGYNTRGSYLIGSYNTGAVKGSEDRVGGVCGWNYGRIMECRNEGSVEGNTRVGGVCGHNDFIIVDSQNSGAVTGSADRIGGVCGWNDDNGNISGSDNSGNVTGGAEVDGVCGLDNGSVTDCENTGTVTITAITLESIAVTTRPDKMTYYTHETFDPSGMVVTATYSDRSTEIVSLTAGNFTYDFSTPGTGKRVDIAWGGKTTVLEGITVSVKQYGRESQVLGRGYDVTLRYAHSPDIKEAVLDFGRLESAGLVRNDRNLVEGKFQTSAGSNVAEYSQSLSVSAGIGGEIGFMGVTFGNEVRTRFSNERYSHDAYSIATSTSRIIKDAWLLEYRRDAEYHRQYLTENFRNDIQNKTPEYIIATYGTHVMMGGVWGARLDYNFSARKKVDAYYQGVGVSFSPKAEANLGVISGSVNYDADVDINFGNMYETNSINISTYAVGGRPELAQFIQNNQDYKAWIGSIEGNEVWCDYYPESLIPIYDLVADGNKRQAIIDYLYNDKGYYHGKEITVTTHLVQATTDYYLEVKGTDQSVWYYGKDTEVDSKWQKDTKAWVTITLSNTMDGNINAHFDYWVEEGGNAGDKTVLNMLKDDTIKVNKGNIRIDEEPLSWYSGKVTYNWEEHGWVTVENGNCPFIRNGELQFKVDGPGGDKGNIGVRGTFRVDYSYME